MPSPRIRRSAAAALAFTALAAAAPAAASAASVTVTGDDGNPVAVPAGAPPTIRNMKPEVGVAFPPGEGRYSLSITGANGAAAALPIDCFSQTSRFPTRANYAGNGAYTVTVTNFAASDTKCATPLSTESYPFTIAASTSLAPPAGPFLLRAPRSFTTNAYSLPVALNPGADSHEVRFAADAVLGPDGGIAGNSLEAFVDPAGAAIVRPPAPGVYTVVARPIRYSSAGEVGGPWSAPVKLVVTAPFDVSGGLQFLDSRGPSYSVRIQLREKTARGRVSIALARGTKRGKYKSLGSAKISSLGTVSKRFKVTRAAAYRLRFTFKGSTTIVGGRVTFPIRITRRITFG